MPDFYALIHKESKYYGQDGGRPFAVFLSHSADGYIWGGDPGRYRVNDLVLLVPSEPPLKAADPIPVLVFDEPVIVSPAEAEKVYQASLVEAEWFRPVNNQCIDPWFSYVSSDGSIHR